jgi:hypothetical protein
MKAKKPVNKKRAAKAKSPASTELAASAESPVTPERPSVHLPRIATLYQAVQRDRIGLERSLATKKDVHDPEASAIYDELVAIEQRVVNYLHSECKRSAAWPWLSSVKGIGPRIGGMLIGLIDIHEADTVSALWRYAGLATVCETCHGTVQKDNFCPKCKKTVATKAERRVKGEKLHYNNGLKKTCYLVARQFIMGETQPYERIYRESKEYYQANRPTWTVGHCDYAARRKMVKMFLSHFWTKWREAEGLEVRPPYAMTMPGHESGYIPPKP